MSIRRVWSDKPILRNWHPIYLTGGGRCLASLLDEMSSGKFSFDLFWERKRNPDMVVVMEINWDRT